VTGPNLVRVRRWNVLGRADSGELFVGQDYRTAPAARRDAIRWFADRGIAPENYYVRARSRKVWIERKAGGSA